MTTDYKPLSCIAYERLEHAILAHARLRIVRSDGADDRALQVVPTDLITEQGVEYLAFEDASGAPDRVRLDQFQIV